MSQAAANLNGEALVYAYLAEYVDGETSTEVKNKIDSSMDAAKRDELIESFQKMRGALQLGMQSFYVTEGELQNFYEFVEDPVVRRTKEATRIEQLGRKELFGGIRRRLSIGVVIAALLGATAYMVVPREAESFNALEYIGFEALAIEEEPEGRVDFPSRDVDEIQQYLTAYPGLKFVPPLFTKIGGGWSLAGATVIDYDIARVAVTIYEHGSSKENLFHFSYLGKMVDLPRAETGNKDGLIYQTYESEKLNFVAWQHNPDVVSFFVGYRSAPEMAGLAREGMRNIK